MGILYSMLKDALETFSPTQNAKILMLGLDAAGKTTVLYKLKLNETVCSVPTIGFNVETVQATKSVNFTVWDIGGQETLRPLWRYYFTSCDGLIFIVDSSDKKRLPDAKDELKWILDSDEMFGVPLMVMANKQDLPQACSVSEVAASLGLSSIKQREWKVQGTCATSGEGIYEAIVQFSDMVKNAKRN
jgi:small GTP-binding protein